LNFVSFLHQFRREGPAAQERAEGLLGLCREQGFPHWLTEATILQGWALAEQRPGEEEGIARLRQGLAAHQATRLKIARTYFLALFAEVCEHAQQTTEGLSVLAEALAAMQERGECFYEA